jgi:Domain of unknown function (DUF4157)/OmpA family
MYATAQRRNEAHPAFLQRKCGCGGTCGSCGDKRKTPLDRSAAEGAARSAIPPVVGDVLRSPGQPLAPDTRAVMEPRFQHDFSQVRVHTGARAAESAHAVTARAYTVGSDIVFNSGMYQPRSRSGQRLIAHELTHVVQQANGIHRSAHGISSPSDATERAADRAADTVMAGGTPSIASGGEGVLHREPPPMGDFEGNWGMCSVDFAKLGDWKKAVDCCAKIDPLGKGCVSQIPSWPKPGKNKPGPVPGPLPGLPGDSGFRVDKCFPPEQPTFSGGCCKPGDIRDSKGAPCVIIPKKTPRPEGPEKPPEKPAARPVPAPAEIAFQYDKPGARTPSLKASVTSDGRSAYDALLKMLAADTTLKLTLVGRASPEGTDRYNEDLGGRRAAAVADQLIADGIDASRIDDAPGGIAGATPLRKGVVTTGERGAAGKADRQVRVVFFRTE